MSTTSHPRPTPQVPSTVSEAARAYLGERIQARHGPLGPPVGSDDIEGWLAYIDRANAAMLDRYKAFESLSVSYKERDVNGVRTFIMHPDGASDGPVQLDFHGGGFALGGGDLCRLVGMAAAARTGLTTWSVDYRMPPVYPYPAGLDDALAVYRGLLEEYRPHDVIVGGGCAGGGSAGGNLAAATVLRARDEGLPVPAALMLFSPMVDMTESGDSFQANLGIDHALAAGSLERRTTLYAGGAEPTDAYLSPLYGDVTGFPATLLVTGTRDLLLSDTVRLHRKLREAGVDAELHVWEAMSHGGFGGATPEDLQVEAEIRRFISRVWSGPRSLR
jgi:epsilon-lactone hydrolase